jgi:PadR family transcriptional regulator PadR
MQIDSTEQKSSQMRKGLLEFCILLAISEGRVYSSDILKKLKKANLLVVEGTLYPLLSRLKSQELLTYEWEESKAGPPRKYFELTKLGRTTLSQLQKTWKELQTSINALEK